MTASNSQSVQEQRSLSQGVTLLLDQVADGDRKAADELFALVYSELRALAGGKMMGESSDHTLQSTALVHEVWLKLVGSQESPEWKNRGHFFAAASQAMRRILVDAARTRRRTKRGSGARKHELQDNDLICKEDEELLALDDALQLLHEQDSVKAELVNLRYFGGFTNAQAAEQLQISTATAERYWAFARAWLRTKLEE